MSTSTNHIFINSLKTVLSGVLRLFFILCAWILKLLGVVLTKLAETIEKIIHKRS